MKGVAFIRKIQYEIKGVTLMWKIEYEFGMNGIVFMRKIHINWNEWSCIYEENSTCIWTKLGYI